MSNKRPLSSTDQNDSSLTKKQKLPTLLDSLQQYFQYNDEEDQYIDEVAKYFNNLPDEEWIEITELPKSLKIQKIYPMKPLH